MCHCAPADPCHADAIIADAVAYVRDLPGECPSFCGPRALCVFGGQGELATCLAQWGYAAAVLDRPRKCPRDIPSVVVDFTDAGEIREAWSLLQQPSTSFVYFRPPVSVWAAASSTPRHGRSPHTTPAALRHGEAEATFTADAIAWCGAHGVGWALENPASSKLWQHGVVQTALGNVVHFVGHLDWCAHGGARPGLTRVATSVRALADACDRCPGESASHSHSKCLPGRRSVPQPNEWCRTVARAASGKWALRAEALCRDWNRSERESTNIHCSHGQRRAGKCDAR